MNKQKPLSKTQGGGWWVIRRPNGSIVLGILERTKKMAIRRFELRWDTREVVWEDYKKRGYTCEKVQLCSIRKSESPRITLPPLYFKV